MPSKPSLMDLPTELRFQIFDCLISLPHLILLPENSSSSSSSSSDHSILAPLSRAHTRLSSEIKEWAEVAVTSMSITSPGISYYENCPRLGIFNSESTFIAYDQNHRTDTIRAIWTVVMSPVFRPVGLSSLLGNPGSPVAWYAQQEGGRGREVGPEEPFVEELWWDILSQEVFWDRDEFELLRKRAPIYGSPVGWARVVSERRHWFEFPCLWNEGRVYR